MNEEKVEIYTFSFVDKNGRQNIKFEGTFLSDMFELFSKKFSNYIDTFPPSKLKNQTVKVEKDLENKSNWKFSYKTKRIRGVLIIGKDSDKVLKFTKLDKHKSSGGKKGKGLNIDKPYFFEIIFCENKTKGFFILQKTDNTSCKNVFKKIIQSQLDDKYGTLKLETSTFIEEAIFENYLKQGNYNEITFVRNSIPNDTLQNYLGDYIEDGTFSLQTKIKAEDNSDFATKFKNKIYDSFESKQSFFEIPELGEMGFNKDNSFIKVNSTYNGKTRTIDLSDTMKVKPLYPLGEVISNDDGYAEFESISKKVNDLIVELDLDIL